MIPNSASLMIRRFMGVGTPERVVDEIVRQGKRDLTVIANVTASPSPAASGKDKFHRMIGLARLIKIAQSRLEVPGAGCLISSEQRGGEAHHAVRVASGTRALRRPPSLGATAAAFYRPGRGRAAYRSPDHGSLRRMRHPRKSASAGFPKRSAIFEQALPKHEQGHKSRQH